jgi:nucleotide-binding universal stress UspA family protein
MSWLPKKSVVVPVDFSDASKAAVDMALEFVDAPGHLHAIHVSPSIFPTEIGYVWETYDEQQFMAAAEEALRNWLADAKYEGVDLVIKMGNPGHEIVNFAQDVLADLIVIPSHGRTGVKRILLGSVAERVVRLADCPVLVLKPPA